MNKIVDWIKSNKLSSFLLVIVAFFIASKLIPAPLRYTPSSKTSLIYPQEASFNEAYTYDESDYAIGSSRGGPATVGTDALSIPSSEYSPEIDVEDRMVVKTSSMSLLVENVTASVEGAIEATLSLGGYMVSSNINRPESGENGVLVVRVPVGSLDEALEFYRSLGVRVVSENILGSDVTDQYTDIEARLDVLYKTKEKFEAILVSASEVSDVLAVQRELTNIQRQIDSLKGQADYLEKTSASAKITLYLSTDELSLPYAPSAPWRPGVVLKQAVRQLILTLRGVGSLAIWIIVYAVIWVPLLLGVIFIPKFIKKLLRRWKK